MTIDEAIRQFKYDAECNRADLDLSYAEDNEQLAEWLEELKDYRDKNKMVVRIDYANSDEFKDMAVKLAKEQYNKAVDDFVKLAKEHNWNIRNRNENEFIYGAIDRLAEQLKAGEVNE